MPPVVRAAVEVGHGPREAASQPSDDEDHDEHRDRPQPRPRRRARAGRHAPAPDGDEYGAHDSGQADARQQQAGALEPRDRDAAVGDHRQPERPPRLGDVGEHTEHDGEEADDEEQQQRDVADDLDVDRGQLGDDPVVAQPADAHDRAEHGRQHDPGHGDAQRVLQAHDHGVAHWRVLRQRVARDLERCRVVEEGERRRDVLAVGVARVVAPQPPDDRQHDGEDEELDRPLQDANVAVQRWS